MTAAAKTRRRPMKVMTDEEATAKAVGDMTPEQVEKTVQALNLFLCNVPKVKETAALRVQCAVMVETLR